MISKIKDYINTVLLLLYIQSPLVVNAEETAKVADNLTQSTATKLTADSIVNMRTVVNLISGVSIGLAFILTTIALGINAYQQSKAIQTGDFGRSQQEWGQMVKLVRNVALFAAIMGIFGVIVSTILGVAYPDIFS